ncbi:unnamed protein product [Arabidopsis halleri]
MQLAFSGDGFTRIDCLRPFPSLTPVLFSPLFPCCSRPMHRLRWRLGKFVEEIAIYVGFFLASSPDLLSQSQSSASELTFNKADDEVIGRAIAIKIFSNIPSIQLRFSLSRKTPTSDEPKPKRLRKAKDTKTSSSILNMP